MKIEWRRQRLEYTHPWKIAVGRASRGRETIVVSIEDDGIVGFGEIAPSGLYGQSLDSAEAALARIRPTLADRSPRLIETLLETLVPALAGESATLCAIDAALHDWVGKALGQPVHRLLGIDPDRMPATSFTIGIDDEATTALKVREAAAAGWRVLKIKLDSSPADRILDPVCAAWDGPVRVDINTAWTPETAPGQLRRMAAFPVEFVEQPYPVDLDADLAGFREICPVPVLVDESFRHIGDLPPLIGRVDGINIKLSKCGGIRQGLTAIHAARRHGLKVMLGCMTQSSLAISAAAQLGPLVDYVDLDGHLLLKDDPWRGLGIRGGAIVLSDGPGLGVEAVA